MICDKCHGRGELPEAKVCANDRCGREFTVQEGRAEKGQFRHTGVLYCSTSCARSAIQRAYRARIRASVG